MNEVQLAIVHNSKSKRENLNLYISTVVLKKHVLSEEMSSKKEHQEEYHQIIATFHKCTICRAINM